MKARTTVSALVLLVLSSVGAGSAYAGFVNGNFATGDLTGWTASAIDQGGNSVTPLISVATSAAGNSAVFDTGTFAAGPFDSTLSQSFQVTAAEPVLSFDFNRLPTLSSDPTGTGTSPFLDSFVASVSDGTTTYTLLLVDGTGSLTDPFGTAPGSVTIGSSLNSPLNSTLHADLSSLAGQTLTLYLDVTSSDDGSQSTFSMTNALTSPLSLPNTIPEPNSLVLISIGSVASWLLVRKRRRTKPA